MAYENIIAELQTNATGFVGNLLEGVFAFAILVIIMFVGVFVASILGKILRHFFERVKMEGFLKLHGVHDAFLGFSFTNIAVALLELYVIIAFLGIAADVVSVPMLYLLSAQATSYLPSLVQGVVIMIVGLMAGHYITDRMKTSKKIPFANTVAIVVYLFIAYNALVIAMPLLLPAADPSLLVWSFLVVLGALAFGVGLGAAIAIGLGMKGAVADVAKKRRKEFDKIL